MQKYNFLSYYMHDTVIFCNFVCKTRSTMFDLTEYFPITDPTLIFFVVLLIILFAPIIMGKLRIPHIIGMVLAGVLLGQYGLNILVRDDSFELFGKVGLYYIMFLAALEMDNEGLKKNKYRLLTFGLLTFVIPFGLTYSTCTMLLGYGDTYCEHLHSWLSAHFGYNAELYNGLKHSHLLPYCEPLRFAEQAERHAQRRRNDDCAVPCACSNSSGGIGRW